MFIICRFNGLIEKIYEGFRIDSKTFLVFLIAGLPSFIVALVLNYVLVSFFFWPIPVAYALVLLIQVSINFFMAKNYVFKTKANTTLAIQYFQFISGIFAFRFFDWLLYLVLTQVLATHFIIIQFGNIVVFSLLKYRFAKRVIEGR